MNNFGEKVSFIWGVADAHEGLSSSSRFLWLASADLAVKRVQDRVSLGGHHVPEVDIRRRYVSGLRNCFHLYLPLTKTWRVYDNSDPSGPRLIARGKDIRTSIIIDERLWAHIAGEAKHAR